MALVFPFHLRVVVAVGVDVGSFYRCPLKIHPFFSIADEQQEVRANVRMRSKPVLHVAYR